MASWGCILLLPNAGVPCYLLLLLHFPLPIAVVHRYCLSPGAPMGARRGLSQALIPKIADALSAPVSCCQKRYKSATQPTRRQLTKFCSQKMAYKCNPVNCYVSEVGFFSSGKALTE